MSEPMVQIEGLAELSDLLTQEAPRAAKRYLNRAADPATEVVLDAMRDTVPVGIGILEEELGSDKHFEDVAGATVLTVDIGPFKPSSKWGSLQEFGSQDVEGTDSAGRHFHHTAQPGQHWVGRAWEASKEKVLEVFATEATGILLDLQNKKK
jgi:hypothetical protein